MARRNERWWRWCWSGANWRGGNTETSPGLGSAISCAEDTTVGTGDGWVWAIRRASISASAVVVSLSIGPDVSWSKERMLSGRHCNQISFFKSISTGTLDEVEGKRHKDLISFHTCVAVRSPIDWFGMSSTRRARSDVDGENSRSNCCFRVSYNMISGCSSSQGARRRNTDSGSDSKT